jgi:hypothetical protein
MMDWPLSRDVLMREDDRFVSDTGHAQTPLGCGSTTSNFHPFRQLRDNASDPDSELVYKHTLRRHAAAMENKPLG